MKPGNTHASLAVLEPRFLLSTVRTACCFTCTLRQPNYLGFWIRKKPLHLQRRWHKGLNTSIFFLEYVTLYLVPTWAIKTSIHRSRYGLVLASLPASLTSLPFPLTNAIFSASVLLLKLLYIAAKRVTILILALIFDLPCGYTQRGKKNSRLPRCVQQASKKKTLLLKDYSELWSAIILMDNRRSGHRGPARQSTELWKDQRN